MVAEASTGAEAIEQVRLHRPDVIAMSIAMDGMSGIEATVAIKREFPEAKIIVVTMHGEDEIFHEALRAGVSGYVLKEAASE